MTGYDDPLAALHSAWCDGTASDADLFRALAGSMRRSARRAVDITLLERPNEEDVDEALTIAFLELLRNGPGVVNQSLRGLANKIAYRRGQDVARKLIRQREQIDNIRWELEAVTPTAADEEEHERLERLYEQLEECMHELTDAQQDVINSVVRGQESLSDWSSKRGVTYEAGRRMQSRALTKLRDCLTARRDARQ